MNILRTFYINYKYQLLNLLAHITFIGYSIAFPYYLIPALVVGWIASNIFHYLYMHRIFTHGHFSISRTKHKIGLMGFTLLNLGSPPVYAAVHMKHHAKSGTTQDPHNPYSIGWFRSILSLWNEQFSPDRRVFSRLLKDPTVMWFHRHHFSFAVLSAIFTPFLIVVAFWFSKIVVVLVHVKEFGYGDDRGADTSRNLWWMKPLTWGEELHNNHHNYASHANHNIKGSLKEFDLLYYIGRMIEDDKRNTNS